MVEKWILLRNRWRHEAFVLVQPNPVVAMKQHVTNGKGDRFIYWDHCPLLADSVEKVAASPCRWQNCFVSERGGEQHDGTVTGRT
ncbi:hypothetical protein O8J68_31835, partial [Pseudomonas aeruginosa]|uniref:hypothetical protein n=1 Tax=Pseudomonas aeruginosa TaxID=287 RepID=UPI0022B709ED